MVGVNIWKVCMHEGGLNQMCTIVYKGGVGVKFWQFLYVCTMCMTHPLAHFFKTILLIEIKKSTYFTTIFHERLNKKFQRGQVDILIRFWDEDNASFLDGVTATDNQEAFMPGIKELGNFLQLFSDGPYVNLKFLEMMAENRN